MELRRARFAGLLVPTFACLMLGGCEREPETLSGPVAVVDGNAPKHGLLGVQLRGNSLRIEHVFADSPASHAGLIAGDIVTTVNGKPVATRDELVKVLVPTKPGDIAKVTVQRAADVQTIDLRLCSIEEVVRMAVSQPR